MRTGFGRRAVAALAIAGAIAIGPSRSCRMRPRSAAEARLRPAIPALARLAAFGFEAAARRLLLAAAVQIVGSAAGTRPGGATQLGALIDVVTTLDPWVDHPYRFAALWITDDEAAVRKANALLERGIEHHPDDWRNRFYLGFNHFFYLGENEDAAAVLAPAVGCRARRATCGRLVARLQSDAGGGEIEAAAAFLHELLRQNADPYKRAEYEKALDEIETERRARMLDAAREEFERRHGRDIRAVEELVHGRAARAARAAARAARLGMELDAESGQIVSSLRRPPLRACASTGRIGRCSSASTRARRRRGEGS